MNENTFTLPESLVARILKLIHSRPYGEVGRLGLDLEHLILAQSEGENNGITSESSVSEKSAKADQ